MSGVGLLALDSTSREELLAAHERYRHVTGDVTVFTVAYPAWPTAYGTTYVGDGWVLAVIPPEWVAVVLRMKAADERFERALGELAIE